MPRGQKSKLRAREKRRQAQGDSMSPESQELQRATTATSGNEAAIEYLRSFVSASEQREENRNVSEEPNMNQSFFRGPLDERVAMLVHFMLYKYHIKEPISRVEMMKNVIQMYKSNFSEILRRATEHLELIFGLDVKEVDTQKHIYVLINKLEISYDSRVMEDKGVPKTGLLMTVLGVIFTKGNRATEDQVWQTLNVIGLYKGKEHFIFGEPRRLITEDLVRERYLEYRQVPGSDPPCYEFLWGPRAHAETSKMKVLEYLAKVRDTVPSAFPDWYAEALKEEEERAKARCESRARNVAARMRTKAMLHSACKQV
ncbi:melanoma-associated antigen B10-like [Sorex araneus]|uniref:melanoma-associated antigen B10-like n=1 Tax=Sorex araneus TaxID=42254 RepID=UPI0003317126|nr:melanoma-associated antigen B10-like [Sorex araneus]